MQATRLLRTTTWVILKQTRKLPFPSRISHSPHRPTLLTYSSNSPILAYLHRHLLTFLLSLFHIWAFHNSLKTSLSRIRLHPNSPNPKRPLLITLMRMIRASHNSPSTAQPPGPMCRYDKKSRWKVSVQKGMPLLLEPCHRRNRLKSLSSQRANPPFLQILTGPCFQDIPKQRIKLRTSSRTAVTRMSIRRSRTLRSKCLGQSGRTNVQRQDHLREVTSKHPARNQS